MDSEIPKYKKKSNKTVSKSKHKHEYIGCLLHELKTNRYYLSSYCKYCGKVGRSISLESEKTHNNWRILLSQEELLNKYKHLEIKSIDNIFKNNYIKEDNYD